MEELTQIVRHLVGIPQILHAEANDVHEVLHQPEELLGIGAHLGWRQEGRFKPGKVPVASLVLMLPSLPCYLFFWAPWVIPLYIRVAGF